MKIHAASKKKIEFWAVLTALYLFTAFIIYSGFFVVHKDHVSYPLVRQIIVFFVSILLFKYFIYMLVSPWYDVAVIFSRRKWQTSLRSWNPRVSVLVPAWNEEVGIIATIRSLLLSTHKNTEIIVINDGSTDDSDRMIRAYIDEYYLSQTGLGPMIDIVYYYKENGGKGHSLNSGIELMSGEIVLSIDADCIVNVDTIANFVKHFVDPSVMAAVGNVKIGNVDKVIGIVQYLEFLFSFYFKKADSLLNTIYIIGGAAGAFRRSVFEHIGIYSLKNITEDIELSVRIQDAGMKIVYAADAIVYTEGAGDIKSLMSQRLRWKKGKFQTLIDYRHLFFSREKRHNKLLTWVILPLSMFSELQLFFEAFFLFFLYAYSYIVNDF